MISDGTPKISGSWAVFDLGFGLARLRNSRDSGPADLVLDTSLDSILEILAS